MNTKILLLVMMLSSVVFGQEIQGYKLDHYLNELSKNNTEAGSLSIFKKGVEAYHKNFGQENLPDTSSDENKMYQIGSVTKLYTAVIILNPHYALAKYYKAILLHSSFISSKTIL